MKQLTHIIERVYKTSKTVILFWLFEKYVALNCISFTCVSLYNCVRAFHYLYTSRTFYYIYDWLMVKNHLN